MFENKKLINDTLDGFVDIMSNYFNYLKLAVMVNNINKIIYGIVKCGGISEKNYLDKSKLKKEIKKVSKLILDEISNPDLERTKKIKIESIYFTVHLDDYLNCYIPAYAIENFKNHKEINYDLIEDFYEGVEISSRRVLISDVEEWDSNFFNLEFIEKKVSVIVEENRVEYLKKQIILLNEKINKDITDSKNIDKLIDKLDSYNNKLKNDKVSE